MEASVDLEPVVSNLLRNHKTLKLATAGGAVSPWISGAFFAEDGAFTLRCVLEAHGKTWPTCSPTRAWR